MTWPRTLPELEALHPMSLVLDRLHERSVEAVAHYWATLAGQNSKQRSENADRGRRAAVTGGRQMDGFASLVRDVLADNGVPDASVYTQGKLELPGYFRPTKKWDMLVVHEGRLAAALEFKSQVGPSFGNNFNNRSEEAVGVAHDAWTAFREGAFTPSARPFLGWVMLLEDCPASREPVAVKEPHFDVFPEFSAASYGRRYELLLRRLVQERLYDASALVLSTAASGLTGAYTEPAGDLTLRRLVAQLTGHVMGLADGS